MRLKILALIISLIGGLGYAASQSLVGLPQVTPTSPEAATLIRNIQYPVSYAHGSVNISIPLYEITVGDVVIPISISYNHKGVRPFDYTYYLGQGWTLNAEPTISRRINGKPDTDCKYYRPGSIAINDYYKRELAASDSRTDAFPDEYYYSIPGKSGSFIFNDVNATSVSTIPYEPIKVAYTSTSDQKGYFSITDDNGIVYLFSHVEETEIFKADYNIGSWIPTSWKCTSIITPQGTITFDYYDKSSVSTSITEYMIIEDEISQSTNILSGYPTLQRYHDNNSFYYSSFNRTPGENYEHDSYGFDQASYSSSNGKGRTKNHGVRNKRIRSISFPQGTVSFSMSGDVLSGVEVKNSAGTVVREVSFNRGQTPDGYPVWNSVTVTKGGMDEKYTFAYNGTFPKSGHINTGPNQYFPPVNLWGYSSSSGAGGYVHYNYSSINYRREPYKTFTTEYFHVGTGDRFFPANENGILRSISTKSGSVTEFVYESDQFILNKVVSPSGYQEEKIISSGGLRIAKIKQRDHTGNNVLERHFKYGSGMKKESGLGWLRMEIKPDYFTSTKTIIKYEDGVERDRWRQRIIGSSINGDITFSGVPIAYEYVTEYTVGVVNGVEQNYGKTVYHYNHYTPSIPYVNPQENNIPCDTKIFEWNSGYLWSKEVYRYANGAYSKVQSTNYNYRTYNKDQIRAGQVYISSSPIITGSNGNQDTPTDEIRYVEHMITTGAMRIIDQIDSLFTDNGVVVTKMTYDYDNGSHLYPTSIISTESDGIIRTQTLKYPQDQAGITDLQHKNAVAWMLAKNILNPVIEQSESLGGTTTRITQNYYRLYNFTTPTYTYAFPYKLVITGSTAHAEDRIVYNAYDRYGNPLYATKDGVTNVIYLWGYNGQYLVAAIENTSLEKVRTALTAEGVVPEASVITDSNYDRVMNSLRSSTILEEALITTFKHIPLVGIVEITDPRGVATFYDYDDLGRLKTISDEDHNLMNRYQYNIRGN